MDKPVSRATEINLEHFQACGVTVNDGQTPEMTDFLHQMLLSHDNPDQFMLPSLTDMARFFNSNDLQTYDALRGLRQHGFDFNLEAMDTCILIWKT